MAQPTAGGSEHHPEIDWDAAARSPEFNELTRRRRSFVVPALAFVFVWYFGFIALAGYAPDFMGESLYEGFTVGYAARAEPVRDDLGPGLALPAPEPTASSTRSPKRAAERALQGAGSRRTTPEGEEVPQRRRFDPASRSMRTAHPVRTSGR